MKALIALLACTLVAFYAGDCFSESDEICNTWINTDYGSGEKPQKLIFNYDGTFEGYKTQSSYDVIQRGTYHVVSKWTDSEKKHFVQNKGE